MKKRIGKRLLPVLLALSLLWSGTGIGYALPAGGLAGSASVSAESWMEEENQPEAKSQLEESYLDWYRQGVEQGLYANPDLQYTVGRKFQNESIASILAMSQDPSLEGWSWDSFFAGTIFAGLGEEDLRQFQAMGCQDMGEVQELFSGIRTFSLSDTMTLSAARSQQFQQFEMEIYGSVHGPLYFMSLDGHTAFCMDYGKHAPTGTLFQRMDIQSKLSTSQLETIKQGLLFFLYLQNLEGEQKEWGKAVDLVDISPTSGYYLYMQIWVWAALKNLDSYGCAEQMRNAIITWDASNAGWANNYYQLAKDFLENRLYEAYEIEVYAYTSGNGANQDMFTYDFSTFTITGPKEYPMAVGVYKKGVHTGVNLAGASYGVYGDASCTQEIATITTGADGRGTASWVSNQDSMTVYLKEKTAPAGTVLNLKIHSVYLDAGSSANIPYVHVTNEEWSGSAVVTKRDSATEGKLTGATFALQEWNGSAYETVKNLTDQEDGTYATGILYYRPSNQGRFRIVETAAPNGYINRGWSQEFTLTGANQRFTYTVDNMPWSGSATLTKTDTVTGGSLAGAVFTLQEWSGSQFVDLRPLTDQGDGTYSTGPLIYSPSNLGRFRIVETSAPTGYIAGGWSQEFRLTGDSQQFTYRVENYPWTGQALLTKQDAQSYRNVTGAVFTLQEWNGSQYSDLRLLQDNGNGTYSTGPLYYSVKNQGRFRILETTAPAGYQNSGWSQEFVLSSSGQFFRYTVSNDQVRGQVMVRKEDRETGGVAQGDASLDGAVYGLYAAADIRHPDGSGTVYVSGQEVARGTVQNGTVTFADLYLGSYYVQEITSPAGYLLDATRYPVALEYQDQHTALIQQEITVTEEVMKQPFRLLKATTGGNSGAMQPLAGAEFTVKLQSEVEARGWDAAATYDVMTSGKDGWAESQALPYGTYLIRETVTPEGYWKVEDFTVTVRENSSEPVQILLNNAPMEAAIQIVKRDARTQEILPIPGASFKIFDVANQEYLRQPVGGKWVDTFTTDETGTVTTPLTLVYGEYRIEEIDAPPGYLPATEPLTITIGTGSEFIYSETNTPIVVVHVLNQPTETRIRKTDLTTGELVPGAKLQVTDQAGTLWAEWTSQEEEYVLYALPEGEYTLTEIQAPTEDGYVRSRDVSFTVRENGEIQKVEMQDDHTKVEIAKTDLTTGEPVPGATLQIQDLEGIVLYEWITGEEPVLYEYLPVGDYVLVETQAPTESGYVKAESVPFTVQETGQIQKVEMQDDHTRVEVEKVDETTGNPLAGAHLEIRDAAGKLVHQWTSGETAEQIEYLPVGTYTLVETQAPEGYAPLEPQTFTVEETGEAQIWTVKNQLRGTITGEVPTPDITETVGTGDETESGYGILFCLSAAALAAALGLRKSRSKRRW